MIDFLRKNEISLSLNELIERADEFKPNQILPLNKFKNEYKFSHELTQEILTHYRRLDNKKLFDELSPKGWHVGNVAISGNLEGIIEEEHSNDDQNVPKRKRRESRRRRRRGNHGFSSEERDLIMEEILSTPLLKREEEMELGQKIAVLEKRIISYLYSSHRTIINEFYDELENYTGSGQKEKNHAGREYREIVRETHEVLVSEVGEKSVIDLLWNLYSQKRDASYLKSMLKLVCEYDDIKSDVTKWKKCLEKLIMGNSSTSFQVAKKYSDVNKFNKWDDHFQVSFLGQIRASEIWDYTTGNRFNTIGSYWTKAKTTRNINNTGYTVRIPVHLREKLYVVNRGLGEGLSFEEIVSKMGLTKDEIKNLLIAKKIEQDGGSLNKKVGENGDSELIDFVKDENRPNPEEETVEIHKKRAINHAFSTLLTERQAEVMKLRFGIGCEKNHTLEEIGDIFGVTREAVRQAEVRSLKKIRKNIKISSILKEFWQ